MTKIGGEIVGVTKIGGEIVGGVCGEEEAGGGRRSGRHPGHRIKNKNPHTKLWGTISISVPGLMGLEK